MIESFLKENPSVFLLAQKSVVEVEAYLRSRNWIDDSELVNAVDPAGDGNMNYTFRVTTNVRSFILKQSVPWVAKYPQIDAPWDRIIREARFFQTVASQDSLANRMPALFDLDVPSRIAQFQDLGPGRDGSYVYRGETLQISDLESAVNWLSTLHNSAFNNQCRSALTNRDMRALNYEHIFDYPLRPDNGIDLDDITPGLQTLANELKANTFLVQSVQALGNDLYLSDGPTLLHGDFFPGSWLFTDSGLKVIDPEFAFFGFPEFDFGVLVAHLLLSKQSDSLIAKAYKLYQQPKGFSSIACKKLVGIEIIRRLIGVAQLPLDYGLEEKEQLLSLATRLVLEPDSSSVVQ